MKEGRIMQNEWMVISEYCDKCHIEPVFIDRLCESGLIDIAQEVQATHQSFLAFEGSL